MQIFRGENDRPFIPSNRTVSLISWGYSYRRKEDACTIREKGRKDWSMFYCETGKIAFDTDTITAGQLWIYPPGVPQYYKVCAADKPKYYYMHFTGSDIDGLFLSLGIKGGIITPNKDLSELMTAIGVAYNGKDSLSLIKCEYLVLKMFYILGVSMSKKPQNEALHTIVDEMRKNCTQGYDVQTYANIACLSVSRFNHLFKTLMEIAPKTYFLNLKIDQACHLLEMTDMDIKEVSASVGYTDVFAFSKIFKKRTGLSPTKYRKCYQKE